MIADWKNYCSANDFDVEGDTVIVHMPGKRIQRVSIHEEQDCYQLISVVARRAIVSASGSLSVQIWERNRNTALVGFKIDAKGRLAGEAWIPKVGLTRSEFITYINVVASECDRFEFQLTGSDM
jgi:hypothetical protein